jgi:UPF0271 protein
MEYIDLNCDMGEGLPTDLQLMPFISSANIACGFHAGDGKTMKQTVELCLQQGVAIGAHPGFDDREHFGRMELSLSPQAVYDLITTQIVALQQICSFFHTRVHHVKPHGALYNMAARDISLAKSMAKAIKETDAGLIVYGLSGSYLISESLSMQLKTANEVFADRTYQDDGKLTSRKQPNALIEEENLSALQVLQMIKQQKVTSVSGKQLPVTADTVCIHGDGTHAVTFARRIRQTLMQNGIGIKTIC